MYGESNARGPMTPSHLTLCNLEKSKSRLLRFRSIISRKWPEIGHMLLLNTNRKPYMGNPITPSHLTLSDLEKSKLRCWKWSKNDTWMVRYCVGVNARFQILVCSSELIQVCRKFPFVIPTAVVKQIPKVHGPLVFYYFKILTSTFVWTATKSLAEKELHCRRMSVLKMELFEKSKL